MKCYQTNYLSKEYFKEIPIPNQATKPIDTVLNIDPSISYQTVIGFGGAFTEAAAYVYKRAPQDVQKQIMHAYFDKNEGIGYTMGRVVINSSDFSLGNYTYLADQDRSLNSFSIEHEELYTLPMIRDAMKYVHDLSLKAAPWSPPAFMKTNESMNHGGKLKLEYYDLWAEYLIKYLQAMAKKGIHIDYLSIQNEPEAKQVWDSCLYTPEEMAAFVKVLGPKLKRHGLETKLIVLDHNRDIVYKWAKGFASDQEALAYVWGLGIHWYVSEDFHALAQAKEVCPSLHLLFTEGCVEGGPRIGSVQTGERYARNMIGDFLNGIEGYLDWNLVLNEQGGPNHVGNYCDAPLLVVNNQLVINSSYYYIGHFSKYVKPGAKRIELTYNHSTLQGVAFQNVNGEIVVILCNPGEEDVDFGLEILDQTVNGTIKSHTIQSWCL